jgi:hypothetical protein
MHLDPGPINAEDAEEPASKDLKRPMFPKNVTRIVPFSVGKMTV